MTPPTTPTRRRPIGRPFGPRRGARASPPCRSPGSPGAAWRSCSARCSAPGSCSSSRARSARPPRRPAGPRRWWSRTTQRADQVAALQRELDRIGDRRFVLQQARAYGLGGEHEIPFSLAAGAPSLPPDAPGSASVRLGAATSGQPARPLADAALRPRLLTGPPASERRQRVRQDPRRERALHRGVRSIGPDRGPAPEHRDRRLHGRAARCRRDARPPDRRRAHHPQRRRHRDRRRHPLARRQPGRSSGPTRSSSSATPAADSSAPTRPPSAAVWWRRPARTSASPWGRSTTSRRASARPSNACAAHPWIDARRIHGLVFDVATGRLRELT